ncbi:MAG: hypothetical protein KDD35_09240 [Bdellovibrionales bacterium]|nr:hypothetical protein [Bdellovibrionales bacterium]
MKIWFSLQNAGKLSSFFNFLCRVALIFCGLIAGRTLSFGDCVEELIPLELQSTVHSPFSIKGVEVFRRNNSVGLQQLGTLTLKQWIRIENPLSDKLSQYIGLTKEGSVYHLVNWQDRHIARLLSGEKKFTDLVWAKPNSLIAIDSHGYLHFYSGAKWLFSPLKKLIRKGFINWTLVTSTLSLSLHYILQTSLGPGVDIPSLSLPMIGVLVYPASTMLTGFGIIRKFEHQNTFPDGFVPLNLKYTDKDSLRSALVMNRERIQGSPLSENPYQENHFDPSTWKALPPPLPQEATQDIHHPSVKDFL